MYCNTLVAIYHVQLAVLLEEAGDGHAGEHRGGQRQVGVDGRPVLPVPVVRDGRVEAGPEHPQVEGAWEGGKTSAELKVVLRFAIENKQCMSDSQS